MTILAILERLECFSCRPTMVADNTFQCSMAPPLLNPFCRHCLSLLLVTQYIAGLKVSYKKLFGNVKIPPAYQNSIMLLV